MIVENPTDWRLTGLVEQRATRMRIRENRFVAHGGWSSKAELQSSRRGAQDGTLNADHVIVTCFELRLIVLFRFHDQFNWISPPTLLFEVLVEVNILDGMPSFEPRMKLEDNLQISLDC